MCYEKTDRGVPEMSNAFLIATIENVMETLEQASMGGVGENGATIKELIACAEAGNVWEGDADYHTMQYAWRQLELIIDGIKKGVI
jgi:hypothetical protein